MTEEAKKPRKAYTPQIDIVIKAIERGEYDKSIGDILAASRARNELQREAVLAQVREVFGADAQVITAQTVSHVEKPDGAAVRANPFMKGKTADDVRAAEPADEFRIDPKDSEAWRAISFDAGFVLCSNKSDPSINKRFPKFEWDEWKIEGDAEPALEDELDAVEAAMAVEAAQPNGASAAVVPAIEQRGAIISGLASSDIAG